MKIRDIVSAVVLLLITYGFAFADRQLDRTEVLQIFQTLTAQPRKTWIPSGAIEATHLEYKASEEYVTDSTVIVRYDGDRFYWEIDINSRTKQTEPQSDPDGKSPHDNFDLNWNKKRVFAWDGERYTMYFRPSNRVIVTENPSDIPVTVNGPLTAGIVPWGYGVYTLESLSAAESSAVEVEVGGQKQVHLTLKKADTPEMAFVLDPTKDYAVLSCSLNFAGRSSLVKTCGDYQSVSGKWIPTTIIIERYDNSKQPPELLSLDSWNFTSMHISAPHLSFFRVGYEDDALVEYYSAIADRPLLYRYYDEVDTDSLLQDRLAIASANDTQTRNCATTAMKYVLAKLGKEVTGQQLAQLVTKPSNDTSLYAMKRFAQDLGLHCRAVKTDIATLKNLKDCQAILHLPRANHYVVLEYMGDEYVWLIDLDSNKFYYRIRLDTFGLDWSEGTALLISKTPLALTGTFTEINDDQLQKIIGSLLIPGYTCTDLIQTYNVAFCSEPIFGLCGGVYTQWYERYGCEEEPYGGLCTGDAMVGNASSICVENPYNPGTCTITGTWYAQDIRACQ